MTDIEEQLEKAFVCRRCGATGARSRTVVMRGEKTSRFTSQQLHRFAIASCPSCGSSEMFDVETLEAKPNLAAFLWLHFSDAEVAESEVGATGDA
jgi:predicted nucleic-acid-binding Zn-ribbon protein